MNENENLQPVEKLTPFTKMVMSIGTLPSSFYASMSYYESMVWLYEYLKNQVIPTVNNNAEAVEELQAKYLEFSSGITEEVTDFKSYINGKVDELETYMNNYFTNLDVQQEINNKLDAMALDGTLTNLIKNYVDPIIEAYETSLNNEMSNFKSNVNSRISVIDTKVNNMTSGSPLAASSTSGMTDTTRVYVNTTDGYWYYYNGAAWTQGGVYQSTGLDNNEVGYNNLSKPLQKLNYKEITADDIIWIQGTGRYLGQLTQPDDVTSSQMIRVAKGTIIQIPSKTARITFYDINKDYVSDTGTMGTISSYTVSSDGYVVISIEGTIADCTSSYVTVKGIKKIDDILSFKRFGIANYAVYTNKIYVNKGTKIHTTDYGVHLQDQTAVNSGLNLAVRYYNYDKSSGTYVDFGVGANYTNQEITIDHDCYIELAIMKKRGSQILDADISRFNNSLEIEWNFNHENNELDTNFYLPYVGNNADIEIIQDPDGNGSLYFRIIGESNTLTLFTGTSTTLDIQWSSLKTQLSDYVIEYGGIDYIKLQSYRGLYYDLNDSTLKIGNLRGNTMTSHSIVFLENAYGQVIGGVIYLLWLKHRVPSSPIFNSSEYINSYIWQPTASEYTDLFNDSGTNIEAFTFFTDPHLMEFGSSSEPVMTKMNSYIGTLQKVYNSLPQNFIVCGGDWLNNGDSEEKACFKLGYINGFMNSMFKNYYELVGNHDTNEQGTTELNQNVIDKLWYRKEKKAYFKFDGLNSKNYCLDTGDNLSTSMDTYRWTQINWLAEQLIADDPDHATIFMHTIWNTDELDSVEPMAENVISLISAYNSHSTISLNSITYNFTEKTGHVDYILAGHTHADMSSTINGVLCIATTTFAYQQTTPTFDVILNDYDNNKAYFVRFGTGDSRTFTI